MAQLWALYEIAAPAAPCPRTPVAGVLCTEGEAGTWDELAGLDRPLSLSLVTPQRFSAEALLLGIEGQDAWLFAPRGVQRVPLAELAPLWDGRYRYLWRPPAGFASPLSLGDRGAAVAEVAALFARLDAQDTPLAERQFNRALQQRVRLFQRQYGLADDGVVGVQTLVKLNELLGIDPDAAAARQRLTADDTALPAS